MAHAKPTRAVIRADESYPLPDFMGYIGVGSKTMREARRNGLIVRRVGRRSYVLGADWLAYLAKQATTV